MAISFSFNTRSWYSSQQLHVFPPLPLFSISYFHRKKDGSIIRSRNQAHTMDGIAVCQSPTSNSLLVHNLSNKKLYEPDVYELDPNRIPDAIYPSIKYDGGIFCSLYHDKYPT